MILATTAVGDFDRFLETFTTKGAQKRKEHGSKGCTVFRDPNDAGRIWVVFDWDAAGFERFMADPEMQAVFQAAGTQGRPQLTETVGSYDA